MARIIKELMLEKELVRLEKLYTPIERELLMKIMQERINNAKVKIKQDDVMARAFKNSGFSKISKFIGGGETHD